MGVSECPFLVGCHCLRKHCWESTWVTLRSCCLVPCPDRGLALSLSPFLSAPSSPHFLFTNGDMASHLPTIADCHLPCPPYGTRSQNERFPLTVASGCGILSKTKANGNKNYNCLSTRRIWTTLLGMLYIDTCKQRTGNFNVSQVTGVRVGMCLSGQQACLHMHNVPGSIPSMIWTECGGTGLSSQNSRGRERRGRAICGYTASLRAAWDIQDVF